jgi:tRNA G18 (ribose-2'-O)-methylase SpoU
MGNMMLDVIHIDDPDHPAVSAFRDVRERDLTGRQGLFIAEGEVVLRQLVSPASACKVRSLLLAEQRLAGMSEIIAALPQGTPVYCATQAILDQIAGFHLHRGLLGLGEKPLPLKAQDLLSGLGEDAVVVAASGIGNHDNIGGLYRNAAAFGAEGVLLDDLCADPFYRKAIRVSVGAVLRMPVAEALPLNDLVSTLVVHGFEVIALTPNARERLSVLKPGGRRALLLGSEGHGLPTEVIRGCRAVSIPMSNGFDSLNVAATSAIALHQLTRT